MVGRRPSSPGTSGTSRPCRGTRRASWWSRSTAGPSRIVAGWRRRRGRPAAVLARRRRARVRGRRDGWRNVWVSRGSTAPRRTPLLDEPHEHAEPTWGPGQRSFAWSPDGTAIALSRNEDGFGRLVRGARSTATAPRRGRRRAGTTALDWGPHGIARCVPAARTPPSVTVVDPASRRARRRRARRAGGLEPSTCRSRSRSRGAATTARPCTVSCTGRRRPPIGRGDRPPLLVDVHGGPTDQATVDWKPRVGYFVDRGWAVLQPRPPRLDRVRPRVPRRRSPTGGVIVDVDDTVAGIRAAASAAGATDAIAVAVMGGSAGGFTALLVAAHAPPVVRAVRRACSASPTCSTSPRHAPVRVALPRPARRRAARARRALPGTLAGDAGRRDRGPVARAAGRRRQGRPAGAGAAARRRGARRRRRPSSTTCTRARATAGPPETDDRDSLERVDAFLDPLGAAAMRRPIVHRRTRTRARRGADRAVLLAHGAGADMHGAALRVVADALADAKVPSLRFNYPYRSAGRRRPTARRCSTPRRARPRPSSAQRTKLPPERLVLGGRSMGGRYCSLVVGRRRRSGRPRSGCCCSAIRCTPRASRRSAATSTSRGSDAGAVRERHPRLARRPGRPHEGGAR